MSHHDILGAAYDPNPFVVDQSELKDRFRNLQSIIHPDRWAGKSEELQAAAAVMSARVNNALHHLTSPLRRVEYILEQEGFGHREADSFDDKELLMEVMEVHEDIANAQSQAVIENIKERNSVKLGETIRDIEALVGAKDWPAVQAAAIKLKYLTGIDAAAASWPSHVHDH
ncbi:J-type co-chaperone JAC1, mitochondrial [Sparassis crispa]|uniref:J-type co-chaperone JAC1, mitochondrial n=1 Tax=Sparassis crispa TaxID=139825 RepID=A0A401G6Z7_9APHY|nr:J-type co-chaperone JAC1, mitochondrial [Sparassis crispa]GBE77942.1 J-type co-chaperone JAC1, mitochondrial [Sparassis crispa]